MQKVLKLWQNWQKAKLHKQYGMSDRGSGRMFFCLRMVDKRSGAMDCLV